MNEEKVKSKKNYNYPEASQTYRQRMREKGFKYLTFWVPEEVSGKVRDFVRKVMRKDDE